MSKDPHILLRHILESIETLQEYLVGIEEAGYLANMEKQDAAGRRLQVIGEAIVQLPLEFKDCHTAIPWSKIAGLRNRLVHEYISTSTTSWYGKSLIDPCRNSRRRSNDY